MPTPIEAYTTKEFAQMLGVKPRTIIDYIDAKLIKAVPWVDKRGLIPKKEIDRLQKTGIDVNGLHGTLAKRRAAKAAPLPDKTVPKVAKTPDVTQKPPVALSVDDTRFAKHETALKPTSQTAVKGNVKPNLVINATFGMYHGKYCNQNEIAFIMWLQKYTQNKKTIEGTNAEWFKRCKGILSEDGIKNVIMFLRAKRFMFCDGCNTIFTIRNLSEFFTCAPVEGNALPKGYKYV
jgi:hypothetical protein